MSAAQTWLGRSITRLRRRYGKILCPGCGLVVRGFGPSAAIPICRIRRCTRLRLMEYPFSRSMNAIRREPIIADRMLLGVVVQHHRPGALHTVVAACDGFHVSKLYDV